MKVFLKISLLALFITATINADAQKYAIEAGYTNPMQVTKIGSTTGSTTFFYGGKIGVTARYSLKSNANASLLTGVLYSLVYADRQSYGYPIGTGLTYKTTGHFIDIPIHAIYSLPISKNMSFFGYAGPTINIGLAQNLKVTSTQTYPTTSPFYVKPGSFNVYSSGSDYQLNRLNLQIGVGGGVQWKKYQLKSGYDFGITNLNKADTGNLFQKGWYVSFSYQF